MSRVIDLTAQRGGGGPSEPLQHPAGVALPLDGPSDAALIIPEIRSEIRSGAYDADMIAQLDAAVHPGDRVLVIGAGLGVLSTLIAGREGVERVIAVEANTALASYLERTHALNGVEVETVNAVLAEGKKGRVPFFARRDIRASSLLPHDSSWQQVMMVPFMDLRLILEEERISLVVCEIPVGSAELLAHARLDTVERILLNTGDAPGAAWEDGGVCARLVTRGYVPEAAGTAVLFRRANALEPAGPSESPGPSGTAEPAQAGARGHRLAGEPDEEAEESDQKSDDERDEAATRDEELGLGSGAGADSGPVADTAPARERTTRPRTEAAPGTTVTTGAAAKAARPDAGAAPASRPPLPAAGPQRRRRRRRGGSARPPPADAPSESEAGGDGTAGPGTGGGSENGDGGGARLWRLVAVALFLALPLMLIGEMADRRDASRSLALEEIETRWGAPQALTGPFLLVPVEGAGGAAAPLVLLADRLEVTTRLASETRRHDGFEVSVYRSVSEIRFTATQAGEALIDAGETARWDEAVLGLGLSDPAALGEAELIAPPDAPAGAGPFAPGSGAAGLSGIHAPVGSPRDRPGEWRIRLELAGSRALALAPAGGLTVWQVTADWPHPAFSGPFPPALRALGADGFIAEWRVPPAARDMALAFRGPAALEALGETALEVELARPVDLYRAVGRAAKFGLLFIVLTFGAIFLIERSAPRTARVADYALVGAGQCTFFLLLMPLAERIGFPAAYGLGAGATVALLTAYCWWGLRFGPRAGWMTLALAALYVLMYPILLARGHALLMGAVLAFLVVGALMWGRLELRGPKRKRPG